MSAVSRSFRAFVAAGCLLGGGLVQADVLKGETAGVGDPVHTMFVAFDEITDAQSVRHITIVTLDDAAASRPLVIDVEPVA